MFVSILEQKIELVSISIKDEVPGDLVILLEAQFSGEPIFRDSEVNRHFNIALAPYDKLELVGHLQLQQVDHRDAMANIQYALVGFIIVGEDLIYEGARLF